MVVVTDYKALQNAEGKDFFMLILSGEPELVTSQESGRQYLTARTTTLATTFTEEYCKKMVGKEMPGGIEKQECEAYAYEVPETGDVIELNHRWVYNPAGTTVEEAVVHG